MSYKEVSRKLQKLFRFVNIAVNMEVYQIHLNCCFGKNVSVFSFTFACS